MEEASTSRSRSGSETRKKPRRVTFRLSEAELVEIEAAAQQQGQTVGTYIRSRVLTAPTTKARRRPVVEVEVITRLQGELNKIGSNIHQLTRRINFGATPAGSEVQEAFTGYKEVIGAIMAAQGRVPR